ncbi:CRP-like cAMP-binding protein [Pedobacter cryoconitis]|uniref:Crp/Fnr family transcriptional regulator n=1 Tax=Pedobacter cryoconitis TaxID=188932 RepID=UPI0016151D51|nr:Crp/Fnr family transcriptional regulator [Pedobacter cryoconitis]MBB6274128.1 CRP-like cAMP-binding protein [Pedobacter cryoconitis]
MSSSVAETEAVKELQKYIISYFGDLKSDELETISSFFRLELLKKGDYFLKTGRSPDKMSFVQSGLLRVFAITADKEVTQWISTKGYFITDLAGFIFDQPARWTIQALTDIVLYTISKEDYNKIGKILPRWQEFEKLFITRCFTTLEDRVFTHLSMTAEERYHLFFENNKELFNQVPLQYIASMLGMTPETFSRIRKK